MTKPKKAAPKAKAVKPKANVAGTKLQRLETMLRCPEGATIAQLAGTSGHVKHPCFETALVTAVTSHTPLLRWRSSGSERLSASR